MIKNSLSAIGTAARDLFVNWRTLGFFNALYAALLVSVYFFFATKEATAWQLTLTALLAVSAPVLFFILQAAGAIRYGQNEARPFVLLKQSLKNFWKLVLISVPLILLAVLFVYLLNKLQSHFPVAENHAAAARPSLVPLHSPASAVAARQVQPLLWSNVLISSLRLLLLGVALPLAGVHLWLALARDGLIGTLKRTLRILARAFSASSILVYAVGLILFGLMPYFLIFTRTPIKSASAELALFGLRLALAFVFTLWGWLITFGALAKINAAIPPADNAQVQQP